MQPKKQKNLQPRVLQIIQSTSQSLGHLDSKIHSGEQKPEHPQLAWFNVKFDLDRTSNATFQKFRDFLTTLRETAVKEQEVAISQAITKQHFS